MNQIREQLDASFAYLIELDEDELSSVVFHSNRFETFRDCTFKLEAFLQYLRVANIGYVYSYLPWYRKKESLKQIVACMRYFVLRWTLSHKIQNAIKQRKSITWSVTRICWTPKIASMMVPYMLLESTLLNQFSHYLAELRRIYNLLRQEEQIPSPTTISSDVLSHLSILHHVWRLSLLTI